MDDIIITKKGRCRYRAYYDGEDNHGMGGYYVQRYLNFDGRLVTSFSSCNPHGYSGVIVDGQPLTLNPLAKEGKLVAAALKIMLLNWEDERDLVLTQTYSFY